MKKEGIVVSRLTVSLGSRIVLQDLSLEIPEGEFITVLGKNGAGKSTFLKSLSGLVPVQNGDVLLCGSSIRLMPRKDIAKKISYLPQKLSLEYPILVRDFILMGRYPYLRPLSGYSLEDITVVKKVIEQLCLKEFEDSYLHELSGGEQQRVLLASALVQEARFLILDEPTAFLDPVQQHVLYKTLQHIQREHGVGIIVASHNLTLSMSYSSRIIGLLSGGVVFDGEPNAFAHSDARSAVYGVEVPCE